MKKKKEITALNEETLLSDDFCACAETLLVHGRVRKPQWHNCEYVRRVNMRILENSVLADKLTENISDAIAKKREWQCVFARHMDRARFDIMREMETEEKVKQREELEHAST